VETLREAVHALTPKPTKSLEQSLSHAQHRLAFIKVIYGWVPALQILHSLHSLKQIKLAWRHLANEVSKPGPIQLWVKSMEIALPIWYQGELDGQQDSLHQPVMDKKPYAFQLIFPAEFIK
jgi:hypothetical protein